VSGYDILDEAFIDAPADVVWGALIAELNGAAGWWVPHNTFVPGSVPPEKIGGKTQVTVHPKGVDKGGPKLRFTAKTRAVEPQRRLLADYTSGVFRGTSEFRLDPVESGDRTRLSMHFRGEPMGWVRILAKLADVGWEHSKATQAAFANLNAIVSKQAKGAVK
jgi:uncharacterized protein YndB with AHSA1/START domain